MIRMKNLAGLQATVQMINFLVGSSWASVLAIHPKVRPITSSVAQPSAGGSTAAILLKYSSTRAPCRTRPRTVRNDQEETPLRVARLRWPDRPLG